MHLKNPHTRDYPLPLGLSGSYLYDVNKRKEMGM